MSTTLQQNLISVIEGVKANPALGRAVFRADSHLVERLLTKTNIRGFELTVDEPESLGGTNLGPNPVELVLAALATCQEIAYAAYAAVLGIELTEVKVNVAGDLDLRGFFAIDESVPAGFTGIRYETTLAGNATEAQLAQLRQVVETHCPVLDTLTRAIPVTGSVQLRSLVAAN